MHLDGPPSWRQRGWPQPIDESEDFPEQVPRHRQFCQVESNIPSVADDLGTNLDQILPQRGQRPVLDLLWQSQRPHEVGEIVGQGVKLQAAGLAGLAAGGRPGAQRRS